MKVLILLGSGIQGSASANDLSTMEPLAAGRQRHGNENFSTTTFSTLGYGDMYPVGWMRYVAAIQSLIGAFSIVLFVVVFARA